MRRPREHRCIGRLTPRLKETLWLVAQGYSREEIADSLGIGLGTVQTHFHKLRLAFRTASFEEVRRIAFLWSVTNLDLYEKLRTRDVPKPSAR